MPRIHAEGLLYHVMARGNMGRRFFSGKVIIRPPSKSCEVSGSATGLLHAMSDVESFSPLVGSQSHPEGAFCNPLLLRAVPP
jgi:hypothetical protein